MNTRQKEILDKKFKVNEHFTISRRDYEDMPDSMLAWNWSDERMQELADRTNANLAEYDESDPDGMENDFWKTMEVEAVRMGMEYYEDLEEDYLAEMEYDWMMLK